MFTIQGLRKLCATSLLSYAKDLRRGEAAGVSDTRSWPRTARQRVRHLAVCAARFCRTAVIVIALMVIVPILLVLKVSSEKKAHR